MFEQSVLWQRLDKPGHEFARLVLDTSYWHLNELAVFIHDKQPSLLPAKMQFRTEKFIGASCRQRWEKKQSKRKYPLT
ncbi:MAG: hypothetical protein M3033_14300 [Acidobacteriota bacterium]|nr:hypothetical protein [Acidobacteriota bacterium]